jgi:hypothetical protein
MKLRLLSIGLAFLPAFATAWDHPKMYCVFSSNHGGHSAADFAANQNNFALGLEDATLIVEAHNPIQICPGFSTGGKPISPLKCPPASEYILTIKRGEVTVSAVQPIGHLVRAPNLTVGKDSYWGSCRN